MTPPRIDWTPLAAAAAAGLAAGLVNSDAADFDATLGMVLNLAQTGRTDVLDLAGLVSTLWAAGQLPTIDGRKS